MSSYLPTASHTTLSPNLDKDQAVCPMLQERLLEMEARLQERSNVQYGRTESAYTPGTAPTNSSNGHVSANGSQ